MIGPENIQVYVVLGNVDMRKSIDGLSLVVSEQLGLDALGGHMFAFANRRRNVVKVLYYDKTGFCVWMKRLEADKFRWPESREEVLKIGHRELRWLLDGLDIHQEQAHRKPSATLLDRHSYTDSGRSDCAGSVHEQPTGGA